mmetsp:Transcript_55942/g.111162  ORF Transcript_55942/g.111162 Transcript_55942/m.111162 type:complete len:258 (-) Transcript_55942:152-925(-)
MATEVCWGWHGVYRRRPWAASGMRVEAAVFVPAAVVQQQPQTSEGTEAPLLPPRVSKELSASSPEFVPGVPLAGGADGPTPEGHDGSESATVAVEGYGHMMPAGRCLLGNDSYTYMDPREFFTPVLLDTISTEHGTLQVQGQRLCWELAEAVDELLQVPRGSCRESPWFGVAGVRLQLTFFPTGTGLTDAADSAVALQSDEKTKLKFQLFLNQKTSGMKVMLGKKFSCDFRQPQAGGDAKVAVGIEVHENLMHSWFG